MRKQISDEVNSASGLKSMFRTVDFVKCLEQSVFPRIKSYVCPAKVSIVALDTCMDLKLGLF
jgi:hypothetical protein